MAVKTGPRRSPSARAVGALAVRGQLERVLASPNFDAPQRSRQFLRFVVEEALAGRGDHLSQLLIATRVFGRTDGFDPLLDPIVRIQAGRLRRSLERYYLLSGRQDPVRIELPKGGYAPEFSRVVPRQDRAADAKAAPAPVGDGWPVVMLKLFELETPAARLAQAAALLNQRLALEIGRHRDVRVAFEREGARLEAPLRDQARFMLGGRVHEEGEGLRVSAQLVDRSTGQQVWMDEYRIAAGGGASLTDAADLIVSRVAAEEGIIVQLLATEPKQPAAGEPTAYDAMLLGYQFFLTRNLERLAPAVDALRRVVAVQPECGPAWTRLARLYLSNHAFELTPVKTPIDEAIDCARHGVRLDASSRRARCILASTLLVQGELEAARAEVERALASTPGSVVYLEIIGFLLVLLGDSDRGLALSEEARRRNPYHLPHVWFGLWAGHLRRGELEQAYQAALEYSDAAFFWRSAMRASVLGLLGRTAPAKAQLEELLRQKPNFALRGRTLLGYYLKPPELMARVVDGLAKAGLDLA